MSSILISVFGSNNPPAWRGRNLRRRTAMTTTISVDGLTRQHHPNEDAEGEKRMNTNTLVRTAEPVAPARPGWLRRAWLRIRRTVQEMNYANRRLVETQAPWSIDPQWHRR
jgi:hypothetical protein